MSKIDDFNKAKRKSDKLSEFAKSVQNSSSIDKFGAAINLTLDHFGYYGRSSTSSWADDIKIEVVKQIGLELRSLVLRAAQRVERETETVRRMAIEEAKAVLVEIGATEQQK